MYDNEWKYVKKKKKERKLIFSYIIITFISSTDIRYKILI